MTTKDNPNDRPIRAIAVDIFEQHLALGLVPSDYLMAYLVPLATLDDLAQNFGLDSGVSVAAYCLDALSIEPDWNGPAAQQLTKELDARLREMTRRRYSGL